MPIHNLQNALTLGAEGVLISCTKCLNRRCFTPAQALRLWRGDELIRDLPHRCRCRCGAKAARAVAAWPRRSRGGSDPLPIVPKDWGRLP